MHRAQAVSSAVGFLCLISALLFTHLAPADHFVSNGLLLWWETILAVGDLEGELLSVLYFDILGSCFTDLDSFVGICDCSKHKYFPAQRPRRRRSRSGKVPSLAEGMKDRSLLLPSTLKDKTAAYPSCLRTGYSSAVSIAGNGCAETAGFS